MKVMLGRVHFHGYRGMVSVKKIILTIQVQHGKDKDISSLCTFTP
jgi:hypothetical protein